MLRDIEEALEEVEQSRPEHRRWTAVKLFEGDKVTWKQYQFTKQQRDHIEFHINEIETTKYIDREMIIADERYKYICAACERRCIKSTPRALSRCRIKSTAWSQIRSWRSRFSF